MFVRDCIHVDRPFDSAIPCFVGRELEVAPVGDTRRVTELAVRGFLPALGRTFEC